MVGLEDVSKDGIEMEINGNITEELSANLSFAYVDWEYNGPKGGIEEMSAADSNRAKYRINAGVTYDFTDRLQFHLDYKHQDKQERDIIEIERRRHRRIRYPACQDRLLWCHDVSLLTGSWKKMARL
ncbi:MAG: hypothetical protein R2861_10050 [Desulfobacterales bacterium]